MNTYSCLMETDLDTARAGDPGDAEIVFLEALHAVGAEDVVVGGSAQDRLAARIAVEGESPAHATQAAVDFFSRALAKASLPAAALDVIIEVGRVEEVALLNLLDVPSLLGATDVARILGVSRQRVHQLLDDGDLPTAVTDSARGMLWDRRSIVRWALASGRVPEGPPEAELSIAYEEAVSANPAVATWASELRDRIPV